MDCKNDIIKNLRMKIKVFLFFIILICCAISTSAQHERAKIKDYLNKEILVQDNFAGQSITLIKENKEFYILRNFFGSGVPIVGSAKYKVIFNSEYQIVFSEIIETTLSNSMNDKKEMFLLCVEEKGLSLYLNQLKVAIDEKFMQKDKQQ
jgi:hypothetical protein